MAQYNTFEYNSQQYNTNVWAQYLTLSESLIFSASVPKSDAVFLSDSRSASISNKGLTDTIELDVWLQIRRYPVQNDWAS